MSAPEGDRPYEDRAFGQLRPKVIHVTTVDMSLDLLLLPQLTAFAAAGYEVVGTSAPGPYVAGIEEAGIRHIALANATRSMNPWRDLRLTLELYRLFKRERPAIVHTHTPKPGWFGRVAARLARVPVVVNTVHGLYATSTDPWRRRAVVYALERVAAACSDAELLQSREDLPVLRRLGVPASKLQVLGNGIDLERFTPPTARRRNRARAELGLTPGQVVIGAVGRLVWEKGIREVIDAATSLRQTHPEVVVLVAGPLETEKADGLGSSDLDRVTAQSGIVFLGEQREIERFYAAIDIYVLASYREGFPRSAMEAAATGLPLVVTDIRGCRQVVNHDVNGLLVPPADALSLTNALARLADEPALRERMGSASVVKARADFDQQTVIDRTLATYRRLLVSS